MLFFRQIHTLICLFFLLPILVFAIDDGFADSPNNARPQTRPIHGSQHPDKSGQIKDYNTQPAEPAPVLPHAEPYSSGQPFGSPIDLSHPLNNNTLHWPEVEDFQHISLVDEERRFDTIEPNETYHVRQDSFKTSTHMGTHIDAPSHFSKQGWSVDKIPLWRLVDVPLVVVDLSALIRRAHLPEEAESIRTYDIEEKHLPRDIGAGSVVAIYTGISDYYEHNPDKYFGWAQNRSKLSIPGFNAEAANYLVRQGVFGVGIDTLSVDNSRLLNPQDRAPIAHTIFSKNNVYMLENLSSKLGEIVNVTRSDPMALFSITTLPLPIENASGSPVRVIAKQVRSSSSMQPNESNSGVSFKSGKLENVLLHMTLTPLVVGSTLLFTLRAGF